MRLSGAGYLIKQGVRNILNNNIASVATFCVLTVSLLIVGFTGLFSLNINTFISGVEDKNEVVIFLADDADDEYIEELGNKLKADENISEVIFWSKEEALEGIKADMNDAEDIFSYIDENPLPDAYRIKIKDITRMSSTLYAINSYSHIEKVKAPYDFVNILTGLKSAITAVCAIILISLVLVSFVMISNITRASVETRHREIAIMKFVGATDSFIKIPFFIEGLVLGIMAGVAAALLTFAGYDRLVALLSTETTLFAAMGSSGFIPLNSFMWQLAVIYVAAGAVLASIGTVASVKKHVKV
ncbi:permease-like cell division protein FtsX [Huintestinicola sp.]|uniref:permease-like cell division protein FtsX n=1 Tax=Huintestinicola sp. TaxID=2981661 RepID=UPI003D7C84A3